MAISKLAANSSLIERHLPINEISVESILERAGETPNPVSNLQRSVCTCADKGRAP